MVGQIIRETGHLYDGWEVTGFETALDTFTEFAEVIRVRENNTFDIRFDADGSVMKEVQKKVQLLPT